MSDQPTSVVTQATSGSSRNPTGKVISIAEYMARNLRWLDPRALIGRAFGGSFGGRRDLYEVFGWDRTIDSNQMWTMYKRGGIARRVVHAYPDAVWGQAPEVKATAAFQRAWESFVEDTNFWSILHRLDRLSQLGQYAVLLVGLDDSTDMSQPVREGPHNVMYLQAYSDRTARISKWGDDPTNERFGLPVEYTIYPGLSRVEEQVTGGNVQNWGPANQQASFRVHWSRVIHFAPGGLENDVFGIPLLWSCWNYLTDLQKVVGGSSESYWLTANRGIHANLDKDVELEPGDEAALTDEIEEYQHGLRRFIRTRAVDIKSLGSDVANPEGPFGTLMRLIAGTTGIPGRILLGSEAAHNASTQDKGNWAEHVEEYRTLVAGPCFLKPVLLGLIRMGVLTQPGRKKIEFVWPDAYRLSPLERAQRANQRATAANNLGLALKNVPNLATVEEVRDILELDPEERLGNTEPAPPVGGGTPDTTGDGGTPTSGNGDGTTATPGSDSNGKGNPPQGRT